MTDQPPSMIPLEKCQIKEASKVLARAFRDDPTEKFAFPELGGYDPRMPHAFEFMIRMGMKYGYVYTTSPRLEGAAVWMKITTFETSLWRMLLAGAILPGMRMGREAGQRMQTFASKLETKHQEVISDLHWYLQLLGVDPAYQGQGFGSKLLRGKLAEIDAEGLPCYVETAPDENVAMYQHFGFQTLEKYRIPETSISMWLMLRPAQTGKD